jgi:CRISPR system Cascade subunit CasE
MSHTATLARIHLNRRSREVQRDLRDHTQLHKTLMRMVPDNLGETPRRESGVLFRLDETEQSSTLLVQATFPLDPDQLPPGYGRTEVKDLKPMFHALRTGLAVRYRITVNPAKRERLPLEQKGKRGKIIPLAGPDADQWWTHRATAAGLHLHTLQSTPLSPVRPHGTDASPMRHSLIRFDGTATIADPDSLRTALLTGIGRAKSYGAGLLSLAPATTA